MSGKVAGLTAIQRLEAVASGLDLQLRVPDEVRREVAAIAEEASFEAGPGLEDLTELEFVTIDNDDSRDLDQALFVETLPAGWRVWYALADAAHFVRPGTALFEQAVARGVSYYFPAFSVPMLPPTLSEDLVSLNPKVPRRALVFVIDVDHDGEPVKTELRRGIIRSRAKLSYDGVQRLFDEGDDAVRAAGSYGESLVAFRNAGLARLDTSLARGVIEYDRAEAVVSIADDGRSFDLEMRLRNDVERWNEQISVLCNIEGARLLHERGHQSVFRVHLPPLADRLLELRESIDTVVRRHGLPDSWRWDGVRQLAEYMDSLPEGEDTRRVRRAIELQVRYSNRASEFSDRVGPHFALAVEHYARFSAPMREVVGIFTHKETIEALGWEAGRPDAKDEALRVRVIDAANAGKALQKRIDKEVLLLAIDDLFERDLEQPFEARLRRVGTVVGVRTSRLYVLLDGLPLELKVYTEDLAEQFDTSFRRTGGALEPVDSSAPSFGLGDAVELVTREHDAGARRWKFSVSAVSG